MSLEDLKSDSKRMSRNGMLHTLFFLIGFSIIFVVLGFATSLVGTFFQENQQILRQLGAIFMVLFGLMIAGIFTPKFLMGEKKLQFKNRPSGYLGSTLIGLAFAAGWTPCSGPIIGVIMGLGATNPGSGVLYMLMYVLGFAIPFFVLSFYITRLGWIRKRSGLIMKIGGGIMIAFGILLFFDGMTYLTSLLSPIFGDFQGF